MKESSKKEFARSVWAVQVNKMGDGNLAKRANAGNWTEMEARKTEIAMGDCIKSDLERVRIIGKMYRIDRRNYRMQTENVIREK